MNPPNPSSEGKAGIRHESAKSATNGMITKGPYTGQTGHKGDMKETMGTFFNRAIISPNVPSMGSHKAQRAHPKPVINPTNETQNLAKVARYNSAASCGRIERALPMIEEIEEELGMKGIYDHSSS